MSQITTDMSLISQNFGKLGINITNDKIHEMEKLAIHFVLRKTHPLTFDGPYLGVDPVAFTKSDTNALFEIFDVKQTDVEKVIRETPTINRKFNVISDPFNLLSMWLVHLAPIYIKDKKVCHDFMMSVLRYLHYKIFCSVVNNSFQHGANRGVMEATISSLKQKSNIIKYESWKLLIDSHCEKIVDPKGRFYKTIITAQPDKVYLDALAEIQTSLRSKIVTFARAYYSTKLSGDTVVSRSSVGENEEGEKILAQTASVIDSATASMIAEVLNPNLFVNDVSIKDISNLFSTFSDRQLRYCLLKINENAIIQVSSKKFDKIDRIDNEEVIIGIRLLIVEIVRSMVRLCRIRRVNMGKKAEVFNLMKDIYSSSRNTNPDILKIKRSVGYLVEEFNISDNSATKSALRLGIIYYIVYRTILKLHT